MNEKIDLIIKNQKLKDRLYNAGIYPARGLRGPKGDTGLKGDIGPKGDMGPQGDIGPQGPKGESDNIIVEDTIQTEYDQLAKVEDNYYENTHHLKFYIPEGKEGKKGNDGVSETITIGKVTTGSPGGEASINDDKVDNNHILSFVIPQGPTGPKGDVGPTGPSKYPPVSYSALVYTSYEEKTTSGVIDIRTSRGIPGTTDIFNIPDNKKIEVKKSGVLEIIFCGRISGVTADTGASFSLQNATTGDTIKNLNFVLDKGLTPDMDFAEMSVVDITAPCELQVVSNIDGMAGTVKFSSITLLIKMYI